MALGDADVAVAELDWLEAQRAQSLPAGLRGPWGLVLAADCVWAVALVEPFVDALALACDATTHVLLAYTSRGGTCDRVLSKALAQRGFLVKPLPMPTVAARDGEWITTALLYECRKVGAAEARPAPFDFEAHLIEVGILPPDWCKGADFRYYNMSLPYFNRVKTRV